MSMTEITAMDRIMERLSAMRFQITPQEHQLLGVTPEDVQSFSDPALELTPAQMEQAIQEIVTTAYRETPAFRAMVTEDQRRDPSRFPDSARLISKFLKHLRSSLPPERAAWIHPETFQQAHAMVEQALRGEVPVKAPVSQKKYPRLEPLKDEDLKLFGLSRAQITPDVRWEPIQRAILYFLGQLEDDRGHRVKNEGTSKMPDELRESYLFRLLRGIRDLKMEGGRELASHEVKWLGRDLPQLEQIVHAEVSRSPRKEPITKTDTPEEILSKAGELLPVVTGLLKALRQPEFRQSVTQIGDTIDTALPSATLVEDRIKAIQRAADGLGLSKSQLSLLLGIDFGTMSHAPEVSDIDKSLGDTGVSPERRVELESQRKEVSGQLAVLQDLASRDTTGLFSAIADYVDTLTAFKNRVDSTLSEATTKSIPYLDSIVDYTETLDRLFNGLRSQGVFVDRWRGLKDRLFRGESAAPAVSKTAAPDIEDYTKKLEKFKGGGIRKSLDELTTFADDTEEGLEFLRDKLLSIIEARPGEDRRWDEGRGEWVSGGSGGNVLNPTQRDFTGNPLGGKGMSVDEMKKKLARIRTIVKSLDVSRKKAEATEILQYLADLRSHIRASAKKSKKASVVEMLRGLAVRMVQGAETKHPGFAPGASPKAKKAVPPGKGGWIIYRERITKMGKKALESFFKDSPFVARFVEQMEKAGLDNMLLEGSKAKALSVDPVIEKLMSEASGTKGSFDNMLGTMVAQRVRAEGDIRQKVKGMDEAAARVKALNDKMAELNERYMPVLDEYAKFLKDPLGGVREQLEQKRTPEPTPEGKKPRVEPMPVAVTRSNYQSTLKGMLDRYRRGISDKTAAVETTYRKIELPTDEFRRIHGVTEQLAKIRESMRSEKDSLEKARQVKRYLELSLDSVKKAQEYLNDVRPSLYADHATIESLEGYLGSEEAKKDPDAEAARAQLKTLKSNFDHEWHIYSYLTDAVRRAEDKMAREKPEEYLRKLTRDLSDDKVEQLYSVATAPEMEPSKEKAQEIRERVKQHEEGLSFVIDRDTYKRNMNRIMTLHSQMGAAPAYKGEGKTTALPSERLEEYRRQMEEAERRKDEIDKMVDKEKRLMQKQALYKQLIETYERMKVEYEALIKKLEMYKKIQDNLRSLAADKDNRSEDEIKKDRATYISMLNEQDIKEDKLDSVIKKEEQALEAYRSILPKQDKAIESYRKDLKSVEDQLVQMRAPGPVTPQKLRERLKALIVEREGIMRSPHMSFLERIQKSLELDKKILEIKGKTGQPSDVRQELVEEQNLYRSAIKSYDRMEKEYGQLVAKVEVLKKELDYIKKLKEEASKAQPVSVQKLNELGVREAKQKEKLQKTESDVKWYKDHLSEQSKVVESYHQELKKVEDKLSQLPAVPGTPTKPYVPTPPPAHPKVIHREAAIEDTAEPKTEFEIAEELKSFKAKQAPYMKELPKPKGWEVVENFFDESKKDLDLYKYLEQKGTAEGWSDEASQRMLKRIKDRVDELGHVLPAIDAYKKQIVQVGPEAVPFRDLVTRFEDTMYRYQSALTKLLNQREDATRRNEEMAQQVDVLKSMFDPETGEFKGLSPEEITNIKNLFFRELYKRLDTYWSTRVGKNINVFGERDTNWYDNVFRTFKNLSGVRSDKKLMNLLNQYKEVTHSEFPQDVSKRPNRIQALEEKLADIEQRYKDQGIDVNRSPEYKTLVTQLQSFKAQKGQIDQIFNKMSGTVQAAIHEKLEKAVASKVTDGTPKTEEKLDAKVDQGTRETVELVEPMLQQVADTEEALKKAEAQVARAELKLGVKPPVTETPKTAYDRTHPDFNLRILYGSFMQKTIAEMLTV